MNSKLWIRKAISSCLLLAIFATYSMVALATAKSVSGELIVSGKNFNGDAPVATVNGEAAKSGRTIFTSSTIATPDDTNAVINLGRTGEIELAPNTSLNIRFSENAVSVDLASGSVTVLRAAQAINVNAGGKSLMLNAGERASVETAVADDDYRDSSGKCIDADKDGKEECDNTGGAWWLWALVFGGAATAILIGATRDGNSATGGGTVVVSPVR